MFRNGGTKSAPYGSWASPITTELITAESIGLGQPCFDGADLYWIEDRPEEQGRSALVHRNAAGHIDDLVPVPFSVRSRVHEYGGGAYAINGGRAWFINDADQCIYEARWGDRPRQLTQPDARRFADLVIDPQRNRLIAVCEDHRDTGDIRNYLLAIDLDSGTPHVLTVGRDFYSTPRLSPDGESLIWLSWNHPNLPWDSTALNHANFDDEGDLETITTIVESAAESVFQPAFGPDGAIYFISDRDGWWHLYRYDGVDTHQITHGEAEYGMPQWLFGMSTYGFLDERTVLAAATHDGEWELQRIDIVTSEIEKPDAAWTAIDHLTVSGSGSGRCAALIAGTPDHAMALILIDGFTNKTTVVRESSQVEIPDALISRPEVLTFATSGDDVAHALFYPPQNPGYEPPAGEKPPLIVKCHGGPTSATRSMLDLRTLFWTSRGFAVLDVNYRGSTGYGREYRQKLYGNWGVADVDDCVYGARHVSAQGYADAERMAIKGGSAGGYTALCALCFHDAFRAGASYFGVGELEEMFETTHKFESRYGDWLLGPYPQAKALYRERSPVNHADKLNCPVIFLQGLDDKVVPPAQSEYMVNAMREKGLPVSYLAFEGEAHGFRKASTIRRAIEAELYFYSKIFGFVPADDIEPIEIENFESPET